MRAAVLELFSGLHAGARIELTEGDWVIGSDDSCDLILTDEGFAPRHASIAVTSGDVGIVTLDGKVTTLDGRAVVNEVWPRGTIFLFGTIAAAWGAADETEDYWSDLRKRWRASLEPVAQTAPAKEDREGRRRRGRGCERDARSRSRNRTRKTEEGEGRPDRHRSLSRARPRGRLDARARRGASPHG